MSGLAAVGGFILEWFVWTRDWIHVLTITGTPAGIEDILLGVGVGGVAAVIYEEWFGYRLHKRKTYRGKMALSKMLIILCISFFLGTILLATGIHSFYASIIAMGVPTLFILALRSDLATDCIFSGLVLVTISIFTFLFIFSVVPNFQTSYWRWEYLSGVTLLKIPIENLIWFFFAGSFIAPLYEFWYDLKRTK